MKKILTLLLTILLCLSLFGCDNNNNNEEEVIEEKNTTQEVVIDDVKQEETVVEETTVEVLEETTTQDETSVEESKEETTEVIEEAIKEEVVTKPTINAKSYVLHVGIADGITLIVKRISSKVGADLITIKPETTKLYEGDVIEVSVSTSISLNPVYAIDNATNLNNNQYTINASDVTITTGYDYEKHESSASATTYTMDSGTVLNSNALLASSTQVFTSGGKTCTAYNGYISETSNANWADANGFVAALNNAEVAPSGKTYGTATGQGTWRLLSSQSDAQAWASATTGEESGFGTVSYLWSSAAVDATNAYYFSCYFVGWYSGSKSGGIPIFGFVVIWAEN